MLLEFSVSNFKTFKDPVTFSMQPAPKQKGLDASVLQKGIERKNYRALSSAVIFGPNAAGKTNLIEAVAVLRAVMLRGNILNSPQLTARHLAVKNLELIPNINLTAPEPVTFAIAFVKGDWHVQYRLSIDLGLFLEAKKDRKILFEQLAVNGKTVFTRTDDAVKFENLTVLKEFWLDDFQKPKIFKFVSTVSDAGLNKTELYLMNGFKAIVCPKFVSLCIEWLNEQLIVICRSDVLRQTKPFAQHLPDGSTIKDKLNEAAKSFGIFSNNLTYIRNDETNESRLCSVIKRGDDETVYVPAEVYESYGTIRFVNLFALLENVMTKGGTLLLDEFAASIHPKALINIVNIFHDADINVNRAQLIFKTHNPIFLSPTLFRRDEIKFVVRDRETHLSRHYALSDFGTSGSRGVRKTEDYMTNYLNDSYGAVGEVDFSKLFADK